MRLDPLTGKTATATRRHPPEHGQTWTLAPAFGQAITAVNAPGFFEKPSHHRDEEKEHAVMLLEWIRRHDPKFDEHMHTYPPTPRHLEESLAFRAHSPEAAVALVHQT